MTRRPIVFYLIIYVTLSMLFAFYWANNYSKYGTYKGDHFEYCLLVILLLTYVFYLILQFKVKRVNWTLVVLLPLILPIATLALGILLMFALGLKGIPKQTIYLYIISYLIISTPTTFFIWKTRKKN